MVKLKGAVNKTNRQAYSPDRLRVNQEQLINKMISTLVAVNVELTFTYRKEDTVMIKLDHDGTQKIKIFFGFGTVVQGFFRFLTLSTIPAQQFIQFKPFNSIIL